MPDSSSLRAAVLAEQIVVELNAIGKRIVFAESCTAGLVSDFLARIPGASKVFWGSFVTYTAEAKTRMLGVPEELISGYGQVSRDVALSMAECALEISGAAWAFSVTGFAGPGKDNAETGEEVPVGTVWIGIAEREETSSPINSAAKMLHFSGSRNEMREAAAIAVLEDVLARIKRPRQQS